MTITLPDSSYIKYIIQEDEVVIEDMKVATPRKGIGSQLVRKVLKFAKYKSLPCTLYACPHDDSIDIDSLVLFFESLNFEIPRDAYKDSNGVEMRY
jgi:hypothetical protein